MKRSYAVVWSNNGERGVGRLEPFPDRFELCGREHRLTVPFAELTSASLVRRRDDRLRGLPVLALCLRDRPPLRIASLEGSGYLHELADRIEAAGRAVSA